MTTEDRKKRIESEIKKLRNAAAFYPVIRNVIQSFDGKVFNCRLEKAMQEAVNNSFGMKEIDGNKYPKHSVIIKKEHGKIRVYIWEHGDCITLCYSDQEDKRINAEKMIASAKEQREELLRSAAEMQMDLENLDKYIEQIEYLKKTFETISDSLNWRTRSVCDLHYRIINY